MSFLQKGNVTVIPVLHYAMECAVCVRQAFEELKPGCVAVELAETMEPYLLHAASRLPDVSVVTTEGLLYLCEPCDGAMEGLRSALEADIPAFCIDLDVANYPEVPEWFPDPYAIKRIGLEAYYNAYRNAKSKPLYDSVLDSQRELHMARRLKELSLMHESVLFVCGMAHVEPILALTERDSFPIFQPVEREGTQLATLTEASCREVMAECGFVSQIYELGRAEQRTPDRQKIIYQLLKKAKPPQRRLLMRYLRNYALITGRLMPDLFQIISAARSCVDDDFAYSVWELATAYPYRRNIDNLPELEFSAKEIWGCSKRFQFQLRRQQMQKFTNRIKNRHRFSPPSPWAICSYPPEDIRIERFTNHLRQKGTTILSEELRRAIPFSTSLEDGIDVRETIRNWHRGQLYVKVDGKPPGPTGSVVVIFDDQSVKFPWEATWHGEHNQESDMAFYATSTTQNIVGPGISACQYGGLLMTYPPGRLHDIWDDPDYSGYPRREILLMAAIDYAVDPVIVYLAKAPPSSRLKKYARRLGKQIAYLPIGQLSQIELNKIRKFHVLDNKTTREIADDYI